MANMFTQGGLGVASDGGEWYKDPNLLSILLGQGAQVAMGEHQDTWQAKGGKMAADLGASNKYQMASRKREDELMSMLAKAFGFTPKGTPGPTEMKMGSDGTYSMRGDLATDEAGNIKMSPESQGAAESIYGTSSESQGAKESIISDMSPEQISRFRELMSAGNFL